MPYEDTTMWACVATSNLQSCIMASTIVHHKDKKMYLLLFNKDGFGDKMYWL
jgi:hypothetical protein